MDFQIENTPPKSKKSHLDKLSTLPKFQDKPIQETPEKRKEQVITLIKGSGQNPQSKKIQKPSNQSNQNICQFNVSRLQKDFVYEKKLGKGNFSQVGLYKSRMTGDYFAIKVTKSSKMSINEVRALGALSILSHKSKNIIKYYHSWVENNSLHLVMQYCQKSLATIINQRRYTGKRFTEEFIKNILKQSLEGLKVMHENKMAHLDLKPDNLLIKDDAVKISDLGLTRKNYLKRTSELEEGDSRYLAREVLNYHPSIDLTKSDIFSLGLTIFEMITLETLPNSGQLWGSIRDGLSIRRKINLKSYSQNLLDLVEQMVQPDWGRRPSAADFLRNNFFKCQFPRRNRMLIRDKNNKKCRENDFSL